MPSGLKRGHKSVSKCAWCPNRDFRPSRPKSFALSVRSCLLGSRKWKRSPSTPSGVTGHSLGAAGVHEAIYSILQMNNGFIAESAELAETVLAARSLLNRAPIASAASLDTWPAIVSEPTMAAGDPSYANVPVQGT